MRTTLDIDDALLEALRERLPDKSKTEAIETAIRGYLEGDAVVRLRQLAGSFEIRDVSRELRRRDRKT
jgi:putative antitoxin of VapBC-like toxin-antitoxin system